MRLFVLLALLAGAAWWPAGAGAQQVLVLGPHGAALQQDAFIPAHGLDEGAYQAVNGPGQPMPGRAQVARARSHPRPRSPAERTVRSELLRLMLEGAISRSDYRRYSAEFNAALVAEHRLGGTRRAELAAVTINLHKLAAQGQLTVSRLPALLLTVQRNRQWWTSGPLLSPGDRVEFAGSELVWEYYAGQGIELQELGSFGKADGLYTAGPSHYSRLRQLLAELIPLAARRGGGLTWEYYFGFDGGSPPWTSAMSQGTALEALTRAYHAFGRRSYLEVARRALPVLEIAPPTGVMVKTRLGARYLLYSFAPQARVINGFLWTLVGLFDYAQTTGDATAWRLFAAGDREARSEVPHYDTGSWSLYQPGELDNVDYHKLVTGFLWDLCRRTHARVYCETAKHFDGYLARRGGHSDRGA